MRKAIEDNGRAWNTNTEAALNERDAFDASVRSLQRVRDAQIASGAAMTTANAQYDAGVQSLLTLAGQAGATKAQLDALARTYEIKFVVSGITAAFAALAPTGHHGFASGGDTPAFEPFTVGEHGPETMFSSHSAFVATQQQWRGGAASGAQTISIVISAAPGSDRTVMGAITENLRFDVRTSSGGSVQTHLGPRR
jgi:hypothetical protein